MSKTTVRPPRVTGDPMYLGVDLAKVLTKARGLPTAARLRYTPKLIIRRSQTKRETTAHAWNDGRITMTIGYDASIHDVIGTILHEVAHLICWASGVSSDDSSRSFARRCHDLHDEWNRRWGKRVALVDRHLTGAYAGPSGCRDYSKSAVPGYLGVKPPTKVTRLDDWRNKKAWGLLEALHTPEREIRVPGTLADDIQCRYVDPFDGDVEEQPERAQFIYHWEQGRSRKVGKGSQYVFTLPNVELLREALDWVLDGWEDQALSERQAIDLVERLAAS